jgi:sugar lactone lactonase YvrE
MMLSRPVITLLAFASILPSLVAEELYVVQPFTEEIATRKTEGPACDASGTLFFCNMQQEGLVFRGKNANQGNIAKVNADGSAEVFVTLPEGMRGNGMRITPDGTMLIADQLGGHVLRVDKASGEVSVYHKFPEDAGNPNDLALRSDGLLFVSFFRDGLWRITPDGQAEKVAEGFFNGIDFSPDEKTLYSVRKSFDVAEDGTLSNERKLLQVPPRDEGFMWDDGIRTDTAGNIYMARFGGRKAGEDKSVPPQNGAVHMFAPDGSLIRNIMMPARNVTNLAFGGPDGRTVYVTHPGPDGFISTFRAEHPGRGWQMLQD